MAPTENSPKPNRPFQNAGQTPPCKIPAVEIRRPKPPENTPNPPLIDRFGLGGFGNCADSTLSMWEAGGYADRYLRLAVTGDAWERSRKVRTVVTARNGATQATL